MVEGIGGGVTVLLAVRAGGRMSGATSSLVPGTAGSGSCPRSSGLESEEVDAEGLVGVFSTDDSVEGVN